MADIQPMTVTDLMSHIGSEEVAAYGMYSSELASEREEALNRYLGRPYGNEQDGRSKVVSSDIADAVEWILPSLLKLFIAGDEIVTFQAKSAEDEPQAQQETDYVNAIIFDRNSAFYIFNTWFKDALLQKNGYVKAYWHSRTDIKTETYLNLADEELQAVQSDTSVEIIRQTSKPNQPEILRRQQELQQVGMQLQQTQDPQQKQMLQQHLQQSQSQPPPQLHDIVVQRSVPVEYVKVEPVPPEEVLVSVRTRTVTLQDSPFVQHRTRRSISEVRQMGFTIPDDIGDDTELDTQTTVRNRFGEETLEMSGDDGTEREVWLRETYCRVDFDGDGIAELRKICHIGSNILQYDDGRECNEDTELIPIAALTPIIMPHRHIGLSYFDLIQDLALIKTTLLRGLLDNLYLQNNSRSAINTNTVNLEDLLVARPGGIVRVDGSPGAEFMPIVQADVTGAALNGLNYIDEVKENRTGVTKYTQGLDANSLNKTATGIQQIMTASQQRIEMIARCFAETGVKELFWLVHFLTLKHSSREEKLRLRNSWVLVNPREWQTRYDLAISVGIGTGNKDQMLGHLQMIAQVQKEVQAYGMTSATKIYTTLSKIVTNAGFKNPEEFFTDPGPNPPQPPPPPEIQIAQMNAETMKAVEQMRGEAQMKLTQMQSQIKHGADMQIAAAQAQQEAQLEQMRVSMQIQLKEMDNRNRLLAVELQEETKRMIALGNINARLNTNVPAQGLQ